MVDEVDSHGFAERLRELIGEESISRFATQVGLGDNLVRKYLDGATPGLDKVVRICEAKRVNIAWLASGEGEKYVGEPMRAAQKSAAYRYRRRRTDSSTEEASDGREVLEASDGRAFVLLPRYNVTVSAGAGSIVQSEQIVDYLAFEADWFAREVGIPPTSAALFEVRGRSMEPDLYDGELALLDLTKNSFVDDAIYALQYGGALRIKKVQRRIDGRIEIKSSNEADYKPEVVSEEEAQNIIVIGRAKIALPRVRRLP